MDDKINVLVVDDEQIILDSIAKHLKREDYTLHLVLSAEEALELMETTYIDILLTDLMMPNIDGLELMALVRDKRPKLPVIMITGYATINTALQATQLGAFDYVAKPFSKKELLAVIKRAADLVRVAKTGERAQDEGEKVAEGEPDAGTGNFRKLGDQSWLMLLEDGVVVMGVERSYLDSVGKIQTVYLPSVGDEIRQGGVYLQIFSSDLRSHTVISPLSGDVVEVNQKVVDDPSDALQDPYGDGWLIKIKPSRFEFETKLLGL
jgi:CheY-like chemotaxis protein/glycine cleavage system H lipoate-binding protein